MGSDSSNLVRVAFAVGGLDTDLHVLGATGQEGLSVPYRFELDLAAESNAIALDEVVGSLALLGLHSESGERYVHGMISDVQQLDTQNRFTVYRASLVPAVWRLDQGLDCRIFQQQDIETIICGILKKAHVPHSFRVRGNQKLARREYCVQYRESDWAFISRLLEEEGFFYYFEHTRERHVLHMADGPDLHPEIPAPKTVSVHAPDAMVPGEEHVLDFNMRQRLRPSSVMLSDFNFQKPNLQLGSLSEARGSSGVDIYDYPGLYEVPESGKKLAGVRLEEARASSMQAEGRSTCARFSAGHVFTLDGHGRADLNRKPYLLNRVLHRVEKAAGLETGALDGRCSYHNSFLCIPAGVPYRPPRVTPKPVVRGVQTAIVVGPDNEEIYTDEHGRVKVQFHWDREGGYDAHSSCWVRVSQVWAGQGFGAMWIPRIGHEVIVDFLEGNPDRPIITGRVYHAHNPPPYDLPAEKTKSTIKSNTSPGGNGFNELRFEDRKGAEEIFTHAQRDQNEVVRRNMTTSVGNDQTLEVGHDRDKTVHNDETSTIDGYRTESVGKDETIDVKGHRTETVAKNETVAITGNRDVTVGKAQTVEIGKAQRLTVGKSATENITLAKTLSVGANYTVGVAGSFTEKVARKKTVKIGERLTIVCGKSRIVLDKSGKVTIQGTQIDFNSTGPVRTRGTALKMTGSTLNIKTSGVIKMKGSKIAKN